MDGIAVASTAFAMRRAVKTGSNHAYDTEKKAKIGLILTRRVMTRNSVPTLPGFLSPQSGIIIATRLATKVQSWRRQFARSFFVTVVIVS